MSFSHSNAPTAKTAVDQRPTVGDKWIPPAPMPARPPPLPPSVASNYQSTKPTIINYQTSNTPLSHSSFRGDVSIQPNTGHTNSADGDSFVESVWKMRVANMIACALALLLEIPNFLGHVFALQPAKAVLGVYLSFFAGLLCCFEFHNPWVDKIIDEQCGILRHPIGRSFILLLMSGLAMGQATIVDFILGLVFLANAIFTVVAFIRYPEYRRQTEEQPDLFQAAKTRARQYAWANPEKVTNLFGGGEGEGLMRTVV